MADIMDGSSQSGKDQKSNLWTQILGEVSAKATRKLPQNKRIIVLAVFVQYLWSRARGDDISGKTSLLTKLRTPGDDEIKKGSGMEYSYLDVHDEERDEHARLNVWILDGDAYHRGLLKYVITPETARHILVLLVVDMSKPWNIMDTLEQWTRILQEHLHTLKLSAKELNEMEGNLVKEYQNYSEADESEDDSKKSRTHTPSVEDEEAKLPLGENILSHNIGIPLVVVCTKTDNMASLEKENDYKDEHFDFIQKHIRNFCLRYGAALLYTSVKEGRNITVLYKYLIHRIYGFPLRSPPQVVEKDAIFIPMGWDNEKKVSILDEHIKSFDPSDSFQDHILKPVFRKPASQEKEIVAEEEQGFLAQLEVNLSKAPPPSAGMPMPQKELMRPRIPSTPGQRLADKRPGIPISKSKIEGAKAAAASNASEGVLANFFNSLLSKKTVGGKGSPAAGGGDRAAVRSNAAAELERMQGQKKAAPSSAGSQSGNPTT